MFGFFSLAERFDPISAAAKLAQRIVPALKRLWKAILPTLVAIRELIRRVRQAIANFFHPLTRRIVAVVEAVVAPITRPFKALVRFVARIAERVREGVAPIIATSRRWWQWLTAPFRRANAWVKGKAQSIVAGARHWTQRVLGRGDVVSDGVIELDAGPDRSADHASTRNPTADASSGASS